ncbi:glycoside hydrolase family 28 protein [Sphingobacterium sp. MYb382]|uniref:glycoside hydrolase family 28 protein n=1 Tax=Sphingobacterium sp. MYb382 TaxID=2745278 RepID=UPI0030AB7FE3
MMKLKPIILLGLLICTLGLSAKDYNASLFGIRSNGTTLNTGAIQRAVDYISENGGGTLKFYVGRYLTGTIVMKPNVTISLGEGAIILGSTNIYDYNFGTPNSALIYANGVENIGIEGKGVIEGQGQALAYHVLDQMHKGLIEDPMNYDRPRNHRPKAIYFRACKNVKIEGITVKNAADWVQTYDQCEDVLIDGITVDSKAFWNNDGIDIVDCKNFKLLNSYIDAADDAICLKSHDATKRCENIEIRNCTARSSANGIKFGTVSAGGYKNIKIINNKVYNTFRSAFTIATPDGAIVEDVLVDSLYAYNTGNALFLRVGARWNKGRQGAIKNVTIQNVYAEITADKPDVGYTYEGPIEDNPRNISPASILGLVGQPVSNVTLKNIEIHYPGDANPNYAFRGVTPKELDAIPEMADAYPEFSQFKELPAWGLYVRHAEGLILDNVKFIAKKGDYRPALVFDDVKGYTLNKTTFDEPGKKKKQLILHNSSQSKR